MFKLLLAILKDEAGVIDPLITASLIMGGSSLLGGILGRKKTGGGVQEPYEGYYGNIQDILGQVRSKMKGPGETYKGDFSITQPEVEKTTETEILGGVGRYPYGISGLPETSAVSTGIEDMLSRYKGAPDILGGVESQERIAELYGTQPKTFAGDITEKYYQAQNAWMFLYDGCGEKKSQNGALHPLSFAEKAEDPLPCRNLPD